MNFFRLFKRDVKWYLKPFAALSAATCLIGAVLTSALLIGESVRGTLNDNLNKDMSGVKTLVRFSRPVKANERNGVLHIPGFASTGTRTDIYAWPRNRSIEGRDAYCNSALADVLKLKVGDNFSVRVQTMSEIKSEELMGLPPQLRLIRLVYKGIYQDKQADVNFENPQLRPYNLFVNHACLSRSLALDPGAVNEIWSHEGKESTRAKITSATIWELSRLEFSSWRKHPILKSRSYFLPSKVVEACPQAAQGLIFLADSLSDAKNRMSYFFVGAFSGNIFPVKENSIMVSSTVKKHFHAPVSLTCFTTDGYRKISRETHVFPNVTTTSDAIISSVLSPDIPGLTTVDSCSRWKAGIPIDRQRISKDDEAYWHQYKSKPKVYLNFHQARQIFAPGQCTLLIFGKDGDTANIKDRIIAALRDDPVLFQCIPIAAIMKENIRNGIQFAPLFLGLSLFIIISALLILWMLLQLHLLDRTEERMIYAEFVAGERKIRCFLLVEILLVLLPGILLGLVFGVFLCRLQLVLLEHVWNGIVMMDRLNFHASSESFGLAFTATFFSAFILLVLALRRPISKSHFYLAASRPIHTLCALGSLSFFRRFKQYRLCVILLVLGMIGTLGVGAFGIKLRGEDGFSYEYIARTALPVVPSFDHPFPPGGLPVRVYQADSASCSNLLRASEPTVYGCELQKLTGKSNFLKKFSAAADAGSLQWIMKKKLGDVIKYPNGAITLERTMKASVFQDGILVGKATFEALFPNIEGARFFLIKDNRSAAEYRRYLEPYGLNLSSVDAFMAQAESVQNRYLAIFLQLGVLGFILGIGSLLIMMFRNLHARHNEIKFMSETGFTNRTLFRLYCIENLWIYGLSAIISLVILGILALVSNINVFVLLIGWTSLVAVGIVLIVASLKIYFSRLRID
ncbi:MAG: hypothetical protein PHQ27_04215 [Victivallales bacterium]|nr:hypothetical protein [Victivallales bacterium]